MVVSGAKFDFRVPKISQKLGLLQVEQGFSSSFARFFATFFAINGDFSKWSAAEH